MPITFFGGITLKNKKYGNKSQLQRLFPRYVYIPLDEGCALTVKISSPVAKGQALAKGEKKTVFASVSGVFKGIIKDGEQRYIAIENDLENTPHSELVGVDKPLTALDFDEISRLIDYLNIFDSTDGAYVREKLLDPLDEKTRSAKRLIINCSEQDSYSTALRKFIESKSKELVGGAKILMHALGVKKSIFVVESNFITFDPLINEHINDPTMFATAKIKRKYPINEKTIISAIYGREIPHGKRAVDIGYSVIGAEAVINVYESFVSGMPQVCKVVTVSGEGITIPANYIVPIGTPVSALTKESKGMRKGTQNVIEGGVMDGKVISESKGVVTRGTNQILYLNKISKPKEQSCVKCGRCLDVCPMFLSPLDYALASRKNKTDISDYYGVQACIECGSCEYICPRGIGLLKIIRKAKQLSSRDKNSLQNDPELFEEDKPEDKDDILLPLMELYPEMREKTDRNVDITVNGDDFDEIDEDVLEMINQHMNPDSDEN